MPGSALQYDFQPGFDFTSKASVTNTQLFQAISQIAPLLNVGGIVVMNGGNGTLWPGVVSNPRYKRYLWIDTYGTPAAAPSLKVYDQSNDDTYDAWIDARVAADSVDTASIVDQAVTVAKIYPGTARYVMRTNAAGSAVEFIHPSNIFAQGELALNALNIDGVVGDEHFLRRVGGVITWVTAAQAAATIAATLADIPLTALDYGEASNGDIPFMVSGSPAWTPLTPDIILQGGANQGDAIVWNGNIWTPTALGIGNYAVSNPAEDDTLSIIYTTQSGVYTFQHGFSSIPKLVRVVLYCASNDGTWVVGNEVDIHGAALIKNYDNAGSDFMSYPFTVYADNTDVGVIMTYADQVYGGGVSGIVFGTKSSYARHVLTLTSWKFKVYAFA